MDDDQQRTMTVQEIALMREIVKWRKANGAEFFLHRGGRAPWAPGVLGGYAGWSNRTTDQDGRLKRIEVSWDRDAPKVGEVGDYHAQSFRWHEVESVTQAVDVLVAYGYLPARFSSAYRSGWDAKVHVDQVAGTEGEWTALRAAGELLPAVEVAW